MLRVVRLAAASIALTACSAAQAPVLAPVCPQAPPLAPAAAAIPAPPSPATPVDPRSAAVDKLLAAWDKPDSPGCAVGVVERGAVVHARGYGLADLEQGTAISASSVFHVASISKQFTAMSVLLLAERGKLSLDDDLRKYVPEVLDYGQKITLRHLLHHTSGLRDQWALLHLAGWRDEDVITAGDVLDMLGKQRALNFAPGAEHLYSNSGYSLLALVVERVSGRSLRAFTDAEIFGPLGMTSTHFQDDHALPVKGRAEGYAPKKGGGFRRLSPSFDVPGATNLLTTVEDLARWQDNFEAPRVGAAVLPQMLEPGQLGGGARLHYAAGLELSELGGVPTVEHGGADGGFRAMLVRLPSERLSIIALCNAASAQPREIAVSIAQVYLGNKLAPEPAPPRLEPAELEGRAGYFYSPDRDTVFHLVAHDGRLGVAGAPPSALVPIDRDHYRFGRRIELRFTPGKGSALSLVATASVDERPVRFEAVAPVAPSAAALGEVAGTYFSDELGASVTITVKDGALVVHRRRAEDRPLVPLMADAFTSDDLGVIRFARAAHHKVTGLSLSTARARRIAFVRTRP